LCGGHFDGSRWETRFLVGAELGLLLLVIAGFLVAAKKVESKVALAAPAAYLLLQSASGALAIYDSSLYLVCLATHYVEYHVLMIPRCFYARLDSGSRVDRCFGRLRQNRVIFYLALAIFSGAVTLITWQTMGMVLAYRGQAPASAYRFLISLFDGLFVFHYFVESFIWKFSDPHYRQTLRPLYFAPRAKAAA
jgi:hypothetical protein